MSVTLHLKNFRCWENRTFQFNEKGILLLSGISGKGKSTIFNAILYVITGNLKNISSFGKDKLKIEVILEIDDLVITRCKNPTQFTVKKNNIIYELDEAQSLIHQHFGSEFKHISYIDQDNQHSFVYLSPEGKMSFLRNLLLSEDSIEKLKDKIKTRLDHAKKEIISEDSKITVSQTFLSQMTFIPDHIYKINKRQLTLSNYDELFQHQSTNLEKCKKNKLILVNKLSKLEIDSKKYNEQAKKMSQLTELETELKKYDKESLQIKLNDLSDQKKRYDETKNYFEKKKRYDEDTINISDLKITFSKIDTSFSHKIKYLEKIMPIENRINELEDKVDLAIEEDLLSQENLLKEDIKNITIQLEQQNVYECPTCKEKLKLDQGVLIPFQCEYISKQPVSLSDLNKIQKQLENVQKKKILFDRNTEEYNKYFDSFEKLVEEIGIESDFKMHLDTYKKEEQSYKTLSIKIEEIEKRMKSFSFLSDKEEKQVDIYKIIEEIAIIKDSLKRVNELKNRIEEIQIENVENPSVMIDETKEKIEEYNHKIELYKEGISGIEKWKRIEDTNIKYQELKDSIEKGKHIKDYYKDELLCCEKLLNYVKEAETRSIFDFIDHLNTHAGMYIEEFFPDEDISVQLVTNKELKKGKDKIGLFFEVNYKTMKGDIDFLSGGQRDRVNLAFTLAFSELVDNRILLLDECISSLDSETSDIVIDTLKNKYKGKMVLCVAHQVNTGVFDQVIII
jgi:DNA repair exonuclease SbcCD ATPase subunit